VVEHEEWRVVAEDRALGDGPLQVWLDDQPWVLVRLGDEIVGFADRCPHRLAPLSAGRIVDGTIECGYHGWRFAADGRAVAIPSLGPEARLPPRACLTALPVCVRDGHILAAPQR
jgi:vanillate O-demethylase monooxygenase subunit